MADSVTKSMAAPTRRFAERRDVILDVASVLINERGVKGLSLAEVATAIGLGSTSITYYFRRKEDLAAACFDRALDLLERQVADAALAPDLGQRVRRLVALTFASAGAPGQDGSRQVARLTDLRANTDPLRAILVARYVAIFRSARAFFGEGGSEEAQLLRLMRTHVLLDTLSFLPPLLESYAPQDHPRVERRLLEMLEQGLARYGAAPLALARLDGAGDPPANGDEGTERFMGAATRLINERGYRGTSVELIASRLNVTKGSFYHHLDAKDDLVVRCFERSLSTLDSVLDAAASIPGSRLDTLGSVLSTLLGIQLSQQRTPLLRSIALSALPDDLRGSVVARSDRITRRVSGLIMDGISEGSLPPVDPLVAGHMLMSGVNAAFELRDRAARLPLSRAVSLYGGILLNGILQEQA